MRSPIQLPVLDRLQVSDYPLYPGSSKQGLNLVFDSGVTVVAGVNGIGKTTLLNLILRMILGSSNPSKAATRDIGKASRRGLVNSSRFKFFSDRVPAMPASASATLTFHVGEQRVVIKRSLVDLKILKLTVGRSSVNDASNAKFLERMAQLAGLGSAYDFHIVVRYVQFFTEERLPLLWSPSAQVELFKVLFAESTNMTSLNEIYTKLQKVDSDYRNRLYQLNDRRKAQKLIAEVSGLDDLGVENVRKLLNETTAEIEALDKVRPALSSAVADARNAQEMSLRELEDLENQLDMEEHAFHQLDAEYIAHIIPNQKHKLNLLTQGLGSNLGCFMCGRNSAKEMEAIRQRVHGHKCIVCNGNVPKPSKSGPAPSLAEIEKIETRIEELKAEIAARRTQQDSESVSYQQALAALKPVSLKYNELVNKYEEIVNRWPREVIALRGPSLNGIATEEAALDLLDQERTKLSQQYKDQIAELSTKMAGYEKDLAARLTTYAEEFLLEKVAVEFSRSAQLKVVTGVPGIRVPTFKILMTSSTHSAKHERANASSVSESQKEFLDLAFRMTLLDMIAHDKATMLVMETPEASLDSWFMDRAALMIRKFADAARGTRLIATSNVNGTTMIPDLLGLRPGEKLPADQQQRLINLMKLAAEPGVLKDSKAKAWLTSELEEYSDG